MTTWQELTLRAARQALEVEVDLDDDFFEIGGDSLATLELITTLEQLSGVDNIDFDLVYRSQSLRQIADSLAGIHGSNVAQHRTD